MFGLYRALMWAGSFWCHQIPERSPHIFGVQLPLCWRCTGIAFGTLILLLVLLFRRNLPNVWASLVLSLLLPVDVFSVMYGLWIGNNAVRFATGIAWGVFGFAAILHLLALALKGLRSERFTHDRVAPVSSG